MKRTFDQKRVVRWTSSLPGGAAEATKLIMEKLKCSSSKAEKIAAGRYTGLPRPLDQIELAELINDDVELLFPLPKKTRSAG